MRERGERGLAGEARWETKQERLTDRISKSLIDWVTAAARPIRPPQQAIGRLSARRTQRRRLRARSHRRPSRPPSSTHARASRLHACRADLIGPTVRNGRNYILRIVLFIATRASSTASKPPRPRRFWERRVTSRGNVRS